MKKLFYFSLLMVMCVALFIVCKKEYKCLCGGGGSSYVTKIIKDTKKKARQKYEDIEIANPQYGSCILTGHN